LAFVRIRQKYNIVKKKHLERNASHEKLAQLWFHLEKIHMLHQESLSHRVCLNLDLAATTLSCQKQKVVSKKAVSGFKLAKKYSFGS
jgi:hypothetical protein